MTVPASSFRFRRGRAVCAAGFSLVEVVVATAVFATAIVAVLGLMGPLSHQAEDIVDSEVAARLSQNIQLELERIGFDSAVTITDPANPFYLVATKEGDRVLLASGTSPADNPLSDTTLPGIANRDRYFRITVSRQTGALAYVDGTSGFLALQAEVEWPNLVPLGPASATAVNVDDDGSQPTAPSDRRRLSFFFALRP